MPINIKVKTPQILVSHFELATSTRQMDLGPSAQRRLVANELVWNEIGEYSLTGEKLGRALWGGVLQTSARQRALLLNGIRISVDAEALDDFPTAMDSLGFTPSAERSWVAD